MKYYYYFSTSNPDGLETQKEMSNTKKYTKKEFNEMIENWIVEFLNQKKNVFISDAYKFVSKKLDEAGFINEIRKYQATHDFCPWGGPFKTKALSKAVERNLKRK